MGITKKMRENLLTVQQVAEWLGVKPKTIYAWAEQGRIPHLRLNPKSGDAKRALIRFSPSQISSWLRKMEGSEGKAVNG